MTRIYLFFFVGLFCSSQLLTAKELKSGLQAGDRFAPFSSRTSLLSALSQHSDNEDVGRADDRH